MLLISIVAQCQQLGTHLLSLQASRPPQSVESLRHAQCKDGILPGVYLHPAVVTCSFPSESWDGGGDIEHTILGQCVHYSTGDGTSCSDLTDAHDSRGRETEDT